MTSLITHDPRLLNLRRSPGTHLIARTISQRQMPSMKLALPGALLCLLPTAVLAQASIYPMAQPSQAALPPVPLEHLGGLLKAELATERTTGELRPGSAVGIVVGVVEHGKRQIFALGTAKPDSIFEIGSITKTFTATLLAQRVVQGAVRLDEPLRDLMTADETSPPSHEPEITLLSLSDHHSGMPELPANLKPSDPGNPFADYTAAKLHAFMRTQDLRLSQTTPFAYSNLGEGVLGEALASQAGRSLPALLRKEVLAPLGMSHTAYSPTPYMRRRTLQGHSEDHKPAEAWDLDALAGAGGLRSDAEDMLTYLAAQLHPENLHDRSDTFARSLPDAIRMTHVIHAQAFQGMHIALNWFRMDKDGSFWHGGGTGGYSAYALFNPEQDFGVIVLCNTSYDRGGLTDQLSELVTQRLEGVPAVALSQSK